MDNQKLINLLNKLNPELQMQLFYEFITNELKELNDEILKNELIKKNIILYSEPNDGHLDSIAIVNPRICRVMEFPENSTGVERLSIFEKNYDYIMKKANSYVTRICNNKEQLKIITSEILNILKEEFHFPDPELLECYTMSGDCSSEEYDYVVVKYNSEELVKHQFPLCIGNKKDVFKNAVDELFGIVTSVVAETMKSLNIQEVDEEFIQKLKLIFEPLSKNENIKFIFESDVSGYYNKINEETFLLDSSVLSDESVLTKIANKIKDEVKFNEIHSFIAEHFEGVRFEISKKSKYPYDFEKLTINPFFNISNESAKRKFIKEFSEYNNK